MSSQTGWVETRDTTGARPAPRRFSWSWLGVVPFFLFAFAFLIYPAASLFVSSFQNAAGQFTLDNIIGLSQPFILDAYWLSDLDRAFARFGNRGYRAAQLEAAIEGGKAYLAAYALHLGATGLTFFDDDVTAFFSPHAAGKSVMFLVALGPGGRRS